MRSSVSCRSRRAAASSIDADCTVALDDGPDERRADDGQDDGQDDGLGDRLHRTIDWAGDHVVAIDQTLLPERFVLVELRTVDDVIDALARLVVRGAPAIGVAGGLGVALAAVIARRDGHDADWVRSEAARLRRARPTAVNLAWGVDRVLARIDAGRAGPSPAGQMSGGQMSGELVDDLVSFAVAMLDDDVRTNRALAVRGAQAVRAMLPGLERVRVLTHCNAGGLACVEWGTALGIVRALHTDGHLDEVFADETRPLFQGARLTAWELTRMGIRHRVVVDSAGASVIARGLVDVVIVGADRVAANGDVANKIGTYPLALAAARAGIPFVVAAPESTLDTATASGADIDIEARDPDEVLTWRGHRIAPDGSTALNLAFDVTPFDLVTALVTERRVVRLSVGDRIDT